jgi:outer membrane protein assembly factor BamE (lipoprotein component of BamABCDE complex)
MKRGLIVSLGALVLTGCVSLGNDHLFDDATVSKITAGETTKQQVEALLGEPSQRRISQASGSPHEWWAYSAERSTINPLEYVLLVGFLINGLGAPDERRDLLVAFNPDGIVTSLHQQTTAYDMGWPFTPLNVSSNSNTNVARQGMTGEAVRYQDKLNVTYP